MHKLTIRRMFAEQLKNHLANFRPNVVSETPEEAAEITLQVEHVMGPITDKLESTISSHVKTNA